jgi:hypothetical protein
MEQVNAKRVAIFVVSACLIGMVVGSAVTLAVLNVQRAIPSSGMVVAVNVGVYSDAACTLNLTSTDWERTQTTPAQHSLKSVAKRDARRPKCKQNKPIKYKLHSRGKLLPSS